MINEIWKDIEGYEGLYQISNLGRVKSLEREAWNGQAYHILKCRILKQRLISTGYLMTTMSKNGKAITPLVHRLVAETFIPNPENKPTVNHINGNKTDNRLENLEWCTYSENEQHAWKTGLKIPYERKKGEDNSNSKLTDNEVYVIKGLLKETSLNLKEIGEIFDVKRSTINNIKRGVSWKHIK